MEPNFGPGTNSVAMCVLYVIGQLCKEWKTVVNRATRMLIILSLPLNDQRQILVRFYRVVLKLCAHVYMLKRMFLATKMTGLNRCIVAK